MNTSNITVLKNFMSESDFKKILKDVKLNFNKKIHKCWAVKIDKKENNFYHKHLNLLTSVFYLQNKNYYLGTHLKHNGSEIIVPGYENSILIFNGDITHDAVFPDNKLKKPRYTLVTDFNI